MIAGQPAGRNASIRPLGGGAGPLAVALLTFLFVALIYIPTHGRLLDPGGLIAATAATFVLGLSLAVPRVIRGWILGDPRSSPIKALVAGSAAPADPTIPAGRRVAAITAGTALAAAIAASASAVSRGESAGGYSHAIATFIVATNAVLAARSLVPLPRFSGWALVLALIDWRHPGEPRRIVMASRVAKIMSLPVMLMMAAFGLAIGVPALAVAALPIGLMVWLQADRAACSDVLARFLARHTAEDLARPLTSFLRGADPVQVPTAGGPVVSMVLGPGGDLLGFVGPRQVVRALGVMGQPVAYEGAVVPVEAIPVLGADDPAESLGTPIARHGFVLVRTSRGFGYVESGDLARRAVLWSSLTIGADGSRRAVS